MDTSENTGVETAARTTDVSLPSQSIQTAKSKWKLFAWGAAAHGQLGIAQLESETVPLPMPVTQIDCSNVQSIACGMHHSVILLRDGTVLSCGSNEFGQLGHDRGNKKPEQIMSLEAQVIRSVACGAYHTLCVNTNGQVFAFGRNDSLQLGREGADSGAKLVKSFPSPCNVVQVACGLRHSVALTDDGQLFTFGSNRDGQLGIGETVLESFDTPQRVSALSGVPIRQVAAGGLHTLVLTTSGAVFAWGSNVKGQLGAPTEQTVAYYPTQIRPLRSQRVVHIACGEEHSMALTAEGGLFTFGGGTCGQLGHSATANEQLPRKVFELMGSPLCMVQAGRQHTLAQLATGRVYAFGSGGSGQLALAPSSASSASLAPNRTAPAYVRTLEDHRVLRFFGGSLADHCFAIVIAKADCAGNASMQQLAEAFGCPLPLADLRVHAVPSLLDNEVSQPLRFDTRDLAFRRAIASGSPSTQLLERVEKSLCSLACLNSSFLRSTSKPVFDPETETVPDKLAEDSGDEWLTHFNCSSRNHGVDLDAAVDCLRRLSLNSKFESALRRGFQNLVHSLPHGTCNYPDVEALRWCLLVPLSATFEQSLALFDVLQAPLCMHISRLDSAPKRVLASWWSSLQPRHFSKLVRNMRALIVHVLQLMSKSILPPALAAARNIDMIAFLDVLRLLNSVNQQRRIVPFETFYISELNSMVNIRQEYFNWCQERAQRTSAAPRLCDYPFVFDAQAKSIILHTDAYLQMRNAVQYSQANALLGAFSPSNDLFAASCGPSPFMTLCVTRQNLLANALYQLERMSDDDVKKPLKVAFSGEDAVDESGVAKEFFLLTCRELLSPKFGMFNYYPESRLLWFNADAFDEEANMFCLVGTVCGLAIYNAIIVDLRFPLALYKRLLGVPQNELHTIDDLVELDPVVGRSMHQLLEFDGDSETFENTFALNFEITREAYGELKRIELKPGGADLPVTKENRQEYVDLYIKYLFADSCERHLEAFNRGFQRVCGGMALQLFQPAELRAMVIGNEADEFDWSRLEKSARYKNGYHGNHPVIRLFWEVFHSLTVAEKKKFLLFLTGSDRIPMLELESWFIIIQPVKSDDDHLPAAHTCFNLLDLPLYSNKEVMRAKLLQAIENTEGFGLV